MEKYIDVAKEIGTPSALDQELGDIIYAEICNGIDKNERIHLDFSNIESMITPFLNNAIGQLYGKYSSEQIKNHLSLENFPKSKNSTLNLVIDNAKKYYANKAIYEQSVKDVIDA